MTHVAINGALPRDVGTGFAEVQEWEFEATCHPVIPAWFGSILQMPVGPRRRSWCSLWSLACWRFSKSGKRSSVLGSRLKCSVIGKFTQGSVTDGKRLSGRLVIDQRELDFLVRDTWQSSTLVGAPQKCPPGTYPHVLWWVSAPVYPLEGKYVGLRPHQPPLNAFKVYTGWGGPGGHRQHLRPEIRTKEAWRG